METTDEIYDACRDYVHDRADSVTKSVLNKLNGYLRQRNFAKLSTISDQLDFNRTSLEELRTCLQVEAFFKKNAAFADETVCLKAAKESFLSGEARCRRTNKRLDWYYVHRDRLDPDMDRYLTSMEQYCSKVLGNFGQFLEELPDLVRITAGATSTRPRRNALPYLKARKSKVVCSSGAAPYLQALSTHFGYGKLSFKFAEWNRVEFVPKSWKTHRTIACEAEGNTPLQLSFDTWVKRQLRRKTPVNLSSQDKNKRAAYTSSVMGDYSTIDLEGASDSLAYNAVAWFTPMPWFLYLDAIRSKQYRLEGRTYLYEKFSSMGNGTTFPLETLIFAAACNAVGSKDYNVYGDDIIIETKFSKELLRLLAFIGFKVNKSKSHFDGPFRESCGGNFYHGVDITPHYVRANPKLKPELCHLVNGLASRCVPGGALSKRLVRMVSKYRLQVVPFNMDSMSGVHVDMHTAYSLKLLNYNVKDHRWIPMHRAYVSRSHDRDVYDSRTLFLWHLSVAGQNCRDREYALGKVRTIPHSISGIRNVYWRQFDVDRNIVTAMVPTHAHKFRRKWVPWSYPGRATPPHLYWWGDQLIRS